jgi:hypothetical protein
MQAVRANKHVASNRASVSETDGYRIAVLGESAAAMVQVNNAWLQAIRRINQYPV